MRPLRSAVSKVKRFTKPFLEQLEDRVVLTAGTADPFVQGLYQVLLQRIPAPDEVNGWMSEMSRGLTLAQVVDDFLTSAEFNGRMVRADYRNLLGREPEPGIANYWLSVLGNQAGYPELTAEILASAEYFGNHADNLQQWVVGLYKDVLGRQASAAEQNGWVESLQTGTSRIQVARDFVHSHEADRAIVEDAYHLFLGREPEAAGLNWWTAALDGGLSTRQLASDIVGSPEFANEFQTGTFPNSITKVQVPGRLGGHGIVSSFGSDPPVVSTATFTDANGDTLTLQTTGGTFSNVQAVTPPSGAGATFPWGLMSFEVDNVPVGGTITVTLTLPAGAQPSTYYKWNQSAGTFSPFMFDGDNGASISGNVVTLYLTDGGAGDQDGQANGIIIDPGGLTGGTNGLPPDVVPQFNQNEFVNTLAGAQGSNPMIDGFSPSTGVRYADGAIGVSMDEISPDLGFGVPWGQTVTWSNGTIYAAGEYNGSGMIDTQLPYMTQGNTSGSTVAVVTGGTNARTFDNVSGTYYEHEFLADSLVHNSGTSDFTLTDTTGRKINFYDFSTSYPANQRGAFESLTDPGGNVTSVTAHTSSGNVQEVQRSSTQGTTTITDSWLYTYITSGTNSGLLQNVTWRQKTNSGAWTTLRQVAYAYYDGSTDTSNGSAGDLKTATIEDGSGNTLDTAYYRYYVSGQSNGYVHGLKFFFDAASYGRLVAAYPTPSSASDSQVSPYATINLQYDSSQRVTQAVVQGAGASSSGGQGTFTYSWTTSSNSSGSNSWQTKCVETLPDSNQEIVYTNSYGEPMLHVHYDVGLNLKWETYYRYDSNGRLIMIANPSAVTGYDDTKADLVNRTLSGQPPHQIVNYQYVSATTGLITNPSYGTSTTAHNTSSGDVLGYYKQTQIQQGYNGTNILQDSTDYIAQLSVYFVSHATVNRNTDGSGAETTQFQYTFAGYPQPSNNAIYRPSISSSQNGSGGSEWDTNFFDSYGRLIWHKDADGFIDYTQYDQGSGAIVKTIKDVDTTKVSDFQNLPSGWTTPSGGGLHLITTYAVDPLGRTTQVTDPFGNVTYTVYIDTNHEMRVYPGWQSGSNTTTGPTQDYRVDRVGSYFEVLTMSAAPHVTNSAPDGTEAISNLQTLSRVYVSNGGQVVSKDDYFSLSGVTYSTATHIGTLNTNYYETAYAFDSQGRLQTTTTPTGTLYVTNYDSLDRVSSTQIGTSTSNLVTTGNYVYDNNTLGGSTQVGDGDLTQIIAHPQGSAAGRVTERYFDWRDRVVATKDGVQSSEDTTTHRPIWYYTYDNLDEVTQAQHYDGDGVTITSTNGVPNAPSASLLREQTNTSYDDQQRVYQTVVYDVNQSTGSVSSTGLTTNIYYNHRGQMIEVSAPGGLVTKDQYDGAGRQIEEYQTDGASGTGWSAAGSPSGDNVLEQTDSQYDKDGNPVLVTTRQRFHNETITGALGNASTAPKARVSYVAYYYDAVNRVTATVDVGTNGGLAYTRPSTPPSSSATVLVTTDSYNAAGWVQDVVDPRGLDLRTSYDNLGRTTQTIEDYTNGTPTATSNKTTKYTYDGDNHTLALQAVETGGASETTQWTYGVSTGTGSNINSNDILASVQYPDPSSGSPSSSYQATYTVNALGDVLTYTDRAGNVHTYSFDVLGRQTSDAVTTLASGFDNSVLRIQTAYDALSNPYLVTSYNAASGGSVVNQVQQVYDGLDQLITEYQSPSGAVNTNTTPKVQYAYNELAGGANNSRLVSMTYPNGRILNFNYNTGLDNTISRLSSISDTSATLESYKYLGLDTVVERDHPQTNVNLTYISQTGGTGDAGDQYTGLDRFGRVVDQNWYNTSTSSSTDDFQYGYDQNSNMLYKNNTVDTVFSELYHASGAGNGYDGLNQLSAFARGTLSASQQGGQLDTVSSPSTTESWTYDAMGNFSSVTLNGTPTSRTHNQQNEVTAVGSSTLTFDKNGNTATDNQGHTLVFDAWNRLISVKNGSTTLELYSYDGLGRRVTENPGTLRDIYFSSAWQVLEEDVSGSMQDQYVWSPVYVDAMIERDTPTQRLYVQQDANWNVTALVNTSGTVVERYVYDPYGAVSYLNASWGTISGSAYSWVYSFQGGRLDTASGLYGFRYRDYSPTLGRWTQVDPLQFSAGDANLYRFVQDDPISGTDPSGLQVLPNYIPLGVPKQWPPVNDYGLSDPHTPPGKIPPVQFKGPIGPGSYLQFNWGGGLQDVLRKPPTKPVPGEVLWICPLYPGRILYFDNEGYYLGASGPGGKGGYKPPARKPVQTVTIKPGMRLHFEGFVDTNPGGRLLGTVPPNFKPRKGDNVIICPNK
jgi:RHS repeat-associated protein